ncbi:hypothetical protein [Myceligenerans crystallogenes]|uniref:DUF3987 domain-containing protein n=1 Tax=Myceligenerans crystallogenes TaxID=316335 RepID=A0ABN2NFB4_9MICO
MTIEALNPATGAATSARSAYERLVDALRAHGSRVTEKGDRQAVANCPGPVHAHGDRNPSLSLRAGEGQVLVYCHAGDDAADVIAALGLTMADLYDDRAGRQYTYRDRHGRDLVTVTRTPDKKFRQTSADARLKPREVPWTLYQLPEVLAAVKAGRWVVLCEGEKDADQVTALCGPDVVGTTGRGGATNIAKTDLAPLHGANVIAVPDRDTAGDAWAAQVHAQLAAAASELVFMHAAAGKDISDHLAAGHDLAALEPHQLAPAGEVDVDDTFWEARPELATIRHYARAAMASPWAVLGCVLARVALSTPPTVVIPPLGNDRNAVASLNFFVGLVGPSGVGKGVATAAAKGFLDVPPGGGRAIEERPLGSGEGISHMFVETDEHGDTMPAAYSVWFDVPEVDTLTALVGRKASTTASEMRKMFSGEGLGFQNADVQRRKITPAHSYRAALVAGVQPEKAGPLLDDAGGGTPQRFIWLPATDPGAPDVTPDAPEPIRWTCPASPLTLDRLMLKVARPIKQQLQAERRARLREEIADNNGQQSIVRLKVAALLALLNGRLEVTESDWHLADYVMTISNRTRDRMRETLAADAARASRQRAEARAAFDEHQDDITVQRTARKILARLTTEPTSASSLRASLGKNLRENFEPAIDDLTRRGLAIRIDNEYHGRPRTLYRRPGQG